MKKVLAMIIIGIATIAIIEPPASNPEVEAKNITVLSNGAKEETLIYLNNSINQTVNLTIPNNVTITKAIVSLTGLPILNSMDFSVTEVITLDSEDSQDPDMAVDVNGIIHVVWANGTGNDNIIYYKQKQKGTSWDKLTNISNDKPPKTNSNAPSITVDAHNNIYTVWVDEGPGNDNDIFLKNCTSGVWGGFTVLSNDINDGSSIEPQIAVDDLSNLHVVWVDDGNIAGSGNDNDILYRKYNALTTSWDNPIIISTDINASNSKSPSIFMADQYIHIVWEDNSTLGGSGNDYDIFYKYWDPVIGTWSSIFIISDDLNDGESHNTSITGETDGDLYIVWEDNGNINNSGTDVDIVYKCWDYAQDTWSETKIISNDANNGNSLHPTLISGLFDNIYGVWSDNGNIANSGADYDILHKRINGSYNNFYPPVVISDNVNDGNSTTPTMAIELGEKSELFHIVWVDDGNIYNSGLDRDIYYSNYCINYSYPSNIKLDIGDNDTWEWSYPGGLNSTITIGDNGTDNWFSDALNSIIVDSAGSSPDTEIEIPLEFYSDTVGELRIFDINITYTIVPAKPSNLQVLGERSDTHVLNHTPVLGWKFYDLDSSTQGWFEIEVGSSTGGNDMWDPDPIQSPNTYLTYNGSELVDGDTYHFRVRVRDNDGSMWSSWSDTKGFTMNTPPVITSLEPVNGTFTDVINITWTVEDAQSDTVYTALHANYSGQWYELTNLSEVNFYEWNLTQLSVQEFDLRCRAWDGFEDSQDWYNPEGICNIFQNTPPSITITSPPTGEITVDTQVKIQWTIFDVDVNDIHTVDLYFDPNKDATNKYSIENNLVGITEYVWNTATVNEGKYYIYAVVNDGKASNYSYSNGVINVDHTEPITPPTISIEYPPDKSRDVAVGTDIWLKFNQPMDGNTLTRDSFKVVDSRQHEVLGSISYIGETSETRFDPIMNLTHNETYTIIITTSVKDLGGNSLDGNGNGVMEGSPTDDYSWTFTTISFSGDSTSPYIISTYPEDQATNVDNSTFITVTFSEAMNEISLYSCVLIIDAYAEFIDYETPFYNKETNTLTIIPKQKLADNTTYTVIITVDAKDLAGRSLDGDHDGTSEGSPWDNYEWKFTTGEDITIIDDGDNGSVTPDENADDTLAMYMLFGIVILIIIGIIQIIYSRLKRGKFIIDNILIIYNDGRLLTRYHRKSEKAVDDSAVSSMLTAIQDFIRVSFTESATKKETGKGSKPDKDETGDPTQKESFDELRFGKMRILIEYDKKFYIAVIGAGKEVPPKLRKQIKVIKSKINEKYHGVLHYWDGNMASVKGMHDLLEPLMKK